MQEYNTYTLDELSKGKGSYGIAASAVPYNPALHTYLRITDIKDDGTLNKAGLMSVNDGKAEEYLLKPNDIVFARTGNSTGRAYFYDGSDGELVYAGFLIKFSLDEGKVNPRLLKYYTHSKHYYDWVNSFDTGGTRGNINAKTYGSMPIILPLRPIQDRIVEILKSLDDKIEINKRINDNFEQQAQALFKSWFVDFEPFKDGEFVESELGRIPKGWKVGTLNDVAELRKPSIRPQDKIFYTHYSIPAFDNSKKPSADEGSTIKSNKFGISDGAVLLSKLNPSTKRIWYTGIVPNNSVSSTEFLPFYSKNQKFTPFLYCYLNYNRNYNEIANGAKGTTNSHQRIDANSILNRNLAISEEAIDEFCDCCQSFMNLILAANQESLRLAQIRDTLLPKLMSGELKINDVEKNL
ncbi:MAG: restriction endonuclease subunit S [Prevotella sp.]|nr:restriction endonuclease subunit S [Prevotella sp.]